jgi:hypothetical protein
MPFWWLEEPHGKATRPPGPVTPQHLRSVNAIQRTKANRPISYIYGFYFQLAKLAAHRPGPRAAPPSHPTAMGGAHAAICRPRGGFAITKFIQKLEYHPKRASKEPSRQWVIGTQKECSGYSWLCFYTA